MAEKASPPDAAPAGAHPRRRGRLQVLVLVVLLGVAVWAAQRSAGRIREYRRVEAICAAADRGDWDAALADLRPLSPTVPQLREADCRCVALLATGRDPECHTLLEGLLASPAVGDWLPRPSLAARLVEHRRARGDLAGAARLARLAANAYPEETALLYLEADLTAQVDTPQAAIAATRQRLARAGTGTVATALRLLLARQALDAGDYLEALSVLGEQAPPAGDARDRWFSLRMTVLARADQGRELAATSREWASDPDRAARSFATYAFLLSATQQHKDADGVPVPVLLAQAVARVDEIGDPVLAEALYVRYVGTLALGGLEQEAMRMFDDGVQRFGQIGTLDREDLARTAAQPGPGIVTSTARVALRVEGAQPGDRLLLSPDTTAPRDAPYVEQPVPASGQVTVERSPDTWPLRWVLRDGNDHLRGSGAAWPTPGTTAVVTVQPRPPQAPVHHPPLTQQPAAGAPRLFLVVLDCGEWRLVQHGRARRELPVFDALVREGRTAVLSSVPPLTASAMEALVHPGAAGVEGLLGVLHQLGTEVAGLSFVTRNPAEPLAWLLPQGVDLFSALGGGELRVANLLHSYGRMQLGRHGQAVGPHGAVTQLRVTGRRPLRPAEATQLEISEGDNRKLRNLLGEIGGDFDDALELARSGDVDLVALRVAALDLVTHGSFAETATAGQDDGAPLLFRTYRYVDQRLGELYRALDGNDVLLVISDHGARTALEHDPRAFFVAAGGGVLPGRIPGEPELRGVPRLLADFFAVPTDWPATGLDLPRAAGSGTAPR